MQLYKTRYDATLLKRTMDVKDANITYVFAKITRKTPYLAETILLNLYCMFKMHLMHHKTTYDKRFGEFNKNDLFLLKLCLFYNELIFKHINSDYAIIEKEICDVFLEQLEAPKTNV
ncbi:hypothetical protein EHP00_1605 [Ecytonucleospora hepatopenaei]|uniref:Uncharacterized protein n=1 Tax=Ecytonucleospora hepatopenaei TaxID=646526 RepID=A0A1W0E976_9MICR|nr:hypothetical protein EHP00_1605 [Ecytonucleospora hepatopenaei]